MKKRNQLNVVKKINRELVRVLNTEDTTKITNWWTTKNSKLSPMPLTYAKENGLDTVLEIVKNMKSY